MSARRVGCQRETRTASELGRRLRPESAPACRIGQRLSSPGIGPSARSASTRREHERQ